MTEQTPASGSGSSNVVTPQTGLTPQEQRGREALIRAGMDPTKIDARLAAPEGSTRPQSLGASRGPDGKFTTPPDANPRPSVGHQDGTNLDAPTVARARDMVAALRAQGVDEDRLAAALKADGIDLGSAPTLTQPQIEHNRDHGMDRVYSPADYPINLRNGLGSALASMTPADVKSVHAEMAGAMSAMNLPPALGASLAERSLQVGAQVKAMTPAEIQTREGANKAMLQRKWGTDYEARVSEAAAALRMIPDKELAASIARLADPWIIQTLSSHGRNLVRWQAGYPGKPPIT